MEANTAERLETAVATLTELIGLTGHCGLNDTTQFLAMAKLHLQLDIHGISDAELRAFCDQLESQGKPGAARTRGTSTRNRRDAEMRLTGRAWQCGEVKRGRRARG